MTFVERVCKAADGIWIRASTNVVILGHPNAEGIF